MDRSINMQPIIDEGAENLTDLIFFWNLNASLMENFDSLCSSLKVNISLIISSNDKFCDS